MAQNLIQPRRKTGGALSCAPRRFAIAWAACGILWLTAGGCAPTSIEEQFESAPANVASQSPADRSSTTRSSSKHFATENADEGRGDDRTQPLLAPTEQTVSELSRITGRRTRERESRSPNELWQQRYQARQFPEALAALREALRDHPDDPEILYLMGLTHRAAGHPQLAEPSLNRVVEIDPGHRETRKLLCMILMEDGRCAAAIGHIDHLVESGAADPESYLLRASAHLRCGDCPAAEADATEALRRDAKLSQALLVRSATRLQAGQVDRAREDLEAARVAGVPASQSAPLAAQINAAARNAGR